MRRIKKKYNTPKQPWNRDRIDSEKILITDYGLKNKEEIWKAETRLHDFMRQAKRLVALRTDQARKEEKQLLSKLSKLGLLTEASPIEDVLSIDLKQLLDRRLQTCVYKAGLANTVSQARQMVVHGHIIIGGVKVTVPSYVVSVKDEATLSLVPGSSFIKMLEEQKKSKDAKKEVIKKKAEEKAKKENPKVEVKKDSKKEEKVKKEAPKGEVKEKPKGVKDKDGGKNSIKKTDAK
jgi:small subunit ribosomal protein S4